SYNSFVEDFVDAPAILIKELIPSTKVYYLMSDHKNLIAETKSLQIHVEYLITESNKERPNYTSIVLNHIKELDDITINFTFSDASYY
ncbi:8338_t:CDS:2, partial [Cetraspora pellucida]